MAGWAGLFADLLERWSQPHRNYHGVAHLRAVLRHVDELGGDELVRLAAWFHDAVYEGRPDDEENSALLAERLLPGLGLGGAEVAEVARLCRLTATHSPAADDLPGQVLCDADLAVLGGAPEDYAAYVAAVRADYAHVPEELWRPGRAAVLGRLLALPTLFHHPAARDRWQDAAVRNLTAELAALEEA